MRSTTFEEPESGGFVLVGVVMFVLALTILGLSVFSLSSYEAQFLRQAQEQQQAFNDAMSGFERAKFVLTVPPYRLESVQTNLPLGTGVDSTVAVQSGIASGPVSWSGTPVMLRVRATRGRSTQAYVAWFVPTKSEDQYKRLVTSSGGITVEEFDYQFGNPPRSRRGTVHLSGDTWENIHDAPLWQALLGSFTGSVRYDSVPEASSTVASFIEAKLPLAVLPEECKLTSTPMEIEMKPGTGSWRFYRTPPHGWAYSFYDSTVSNPKSLKLKVRGTAIWLLERGIRMDGYLEVTGEGLNPTLVVVANRNGRDLADDPDAGINFRDYFHVVNAGSPVTVIFVSGGTVRFFQMRGMWTTGSFAYNTSIVCAGLYLAGPHLKDPSGDPSGMKLELAHSALVDSRIDWLQERDLLPASATVGGRFTLVAGTWQDVTR